jgi:hypothetical protein
VGWDDLITGEGEVGMTVVSVGDGVGVGVGAGFGGDGVEIVGRDGEGNDNGGMGRTS